MLDSTTAPVASQSKRETADSTAALRASLSQRYHDVRCFTETLCEPLETEDFVVQSMPDVSPTKWHIAHTSWFFETFVLKSALPDYQSPHPQYDYLFNSYYNAVGDRHCRAQRGFITRPTVEETFRYRAHVDAQMQRLIDEADDDTLRDLAPIITLGFHHEQQHQELLLTDIKHVLSVNPAAPGIIVRLQVLAALPLRRCNGSTSTKACMKSATLATAFVSTTKSHAIVNSSNRLHWLRASSPMPNICSL
jgi:hypothetical protein